MSEEKLTIPWIQVDIKSLPSRGVPYPEDAKLRYRTYSFGEVKLSSIGSSEVVGLIDNTMKGIEAEGFSKDKLTFLDVLYIGILRKVSTIRDAQYSVPYFCEKCETEGQAVFSEKSLEFNRLSEDVTALPLCATVAGKPMEFSPLSVRDFLQLNKGRYKNDIKDGEPDKVSLLALMVVNMDFKEAYNTLFSLDNGDDIEVVEEIDKMLLHDLKPVKAVCKAEVKGVLCNHENKILLLGREQLIRPFRAGESTVRSRISAGVPRPS